MRKILLITLCVLATSCSISNHVPQVENQNPSKFTNEFTTEVFVDKNGNFYPPNWSRTYGAYTGGYYSLLSLAKEKNITNSLKGFEQNFLQNLQQRIAQKERVFILIHGYNNDQNQAKKNYFLIKGKIDFEPTKDEFIEFYWDGLVAEGLGPIKIWFNATGYSQVAGELGLRKILNVINNKEIYIITHSRGASVALSALSDPPYDEDFYEETNLIVENALETSCPLLCNENKIRLIMIAPAIGLVDFRHEDYPRNENFRVFDEQIKALHITVNRDDYILRKVLGFLSNNFNPTDLGYKYDSFNIIKHIYPIRATNFSGLKSHQFADYINCNNFEWILKENGIEVK